MVNSLQFLKNLEISGFTVAVKRQRTVNYIEKAMSMMESISNNLVRFAALLSVIGLIKGHSEGNSIMILIEIVMIAMWLQMNYKKIISLIKKELIL